MSVLLGNGLVDVEKREGKVYYTLSKERLRKWWMNWKRLFLYDEKLASCF